MNELKQMIRRKLCNLASFADSHSGRISAEYLAFQLECVIEMAMELNDLHDMSNVLALIEQAYILLTTMHPHDVESECVDSPPIIKNGLVGRPVYDLPESIFEFYVGNDFQVKDMAALLNISESTARRRLQKFQLRACDTFSLITDNELIDLVSNLSKEYPCLGYRSMISLLKTKGHKVQESRVRRAMKVADPEGVLFRRLFIQTHRIHRRGYHVKGPQALWHIDGNHKLIRWRFVIHGGIDGYSRLPVYLKVRTNNRASTVLSAFKEAVQSYGLPERVRSDKGKENVLVADYMLQERGVHCKPFIAGRSVHNQRIERLWREVWSGSSVYFYNLFYQMEEQGILQPHNEIHLAVLHLVFNERIQKHIDIFREALSRRPLRTERNKSPWQLWISGIVNNPMLYENVECKDQLQNYGVSDADGPLSLHLESVEVPITEQLSNEHKFAIENILCRQSDDGVDIYMEILSLLDTE